MAPIGASRAAPSMQHTRSVFQERVENKQRSVHSPLVATFRYIPKAPFLLLPVNVSLRFALTQTLPYVFQASLHFIVSMLFGSCFTIPPLNKSAGVSHGNTIPWVHQQTP